MGKSKKQKTANPIDVVEAAWELERDDRDWLHTLTRAVYPLVDGGCGVSAYAFDMATPMQTWLHDEVTFGMTPQQLEMQRAFQMSHSPGESEQMHVDPEPLGGLIDACRAAGIGDIHFDPVVQEHFGRMGIKDYVAFWRGVEVLP